MTYDLSYVSGTDRQTDTQRKDWEEIFTQLFSKPENSLSATHVPGTRMTVGSEGQAPLSSGDGQTETLEAVRELSVELAGGT